MTITPTLHSVTERCVCGATFEASSEFLPFVLGAAAEFRKAHETCRRVRL